MYAAKSPTKRFPPDVIAEICGIIEYNADVRTIQLALKQVEEMDNPFPYNFSMIDLSFQNFNYEELRELFS